MDLFENKENHRERVLVVGVDVGSRKSDIDIDSSMKELEELAEAAGAEVLGSVVQKRERIDTVFYVGKGKAEEIRNASEELEVDTVIFNNELSGAQIRNLEKAIDRKILDRTSLILDIFANRAASREGKLQVELAQLKYRLPRLVGFSNHLSRLGGGIGTRGPGEQKLEIDRRHILGRIHDIEKQIRELEKVRAMKRKQRIESNVPIVAIVGYTNAGKSTLLNSLIKNDEDYEPEKDVFVKDMLFATLETSLRKGTLPGGREFILTDTVGFVSKLPTKLVEAFKGTLEEVKYADVLLHVLDITNEDLELQMKTTMDILRDLECLDKPIITVLNKCDKNESYELIYSIEDPKIMISAKTGKNLDKLLEMIEEHIPEKYQKIKFLLPYDESGLMSVIFGDKGVEVIDYKQEGIEILASVSEKTKSKYRKYVIEGMEEEVEEEF